jgi:hypothetical protein
LIDGPEASPATVLLAHGAGAPMDSPFTSGDHSFKPTKSSGLSEAGNWATAVAISDQFLRQQLSESQS